MKNVGSIKSTTKIESPKTPGGISKSLLTPCRRVGLSRNWRKSGPSPFISPLTSSQNSEEVVQERISRKRKKESPDKEVEYLIQSENGPNTTEALEDNSKTPTRSNLIRKRSKTLVLAKDCQEDTKNINNTNISKLARSNSKKAIKIKSPQKPVKNDNNSTGSTEKTNKVIESIPNKEFDKSESNKESQNTESNSPNKLTTECMVVIQKGIINIDKENKTKEEGKQLDDPSFDSDSDDVPLFNIKKGKEKDITQISNQEKEQEILKTMKEKGLPDTNIYLRKETEEKVKEKELDADFCDKKVVKVEKLKDKKTSTSDLKSQTKSKPKLSKNSTEIVLERQISQSSNCFDDDDDFDFDHKKTILIKKSYDKVSKPIKAKSTGSITDKDINELKARIDAKKKLLMAKALGRDTEDLRGLIKKWQKGCQDALVELMELMKKQMPDQNIDNSQILKILNIPSNLVGYDSENDCFNSPSDENIILSSLKI